MVQTSTISRPCPAVSAVRGAITAMLATTASGGAPQSTVLGMLGTGVRTTMNTCSGTTTPRQTCTQCVAFRTTDPNNK